MSYLVLARRWRPRHFSELVGQPHVVRTLQNSLLKDRIAHAYLFSGPRGIGKTTTARLLARALNCRNMKQAEPCGECDSCSRIGEGNFIDVIEIDAASNRGIEEIRHLRDGVKYVPLEGRAKTYIIDEVHMLTEFSFNALLKTLEEPPSHAYFCLATTDPQKVPSTILSRCQRFDFRRVSAAEIRAHLEHICKSENIEHDLEALDLIARKADGSVRDSLSLLDQVIAFSDGSVLLQMVVEVLGEIRHDLYFRAINLASSGSTKDAFLLDEELAKSGTDPQDFIIGIEEHLIQILQVRSVGADNVDIPPDVKDDYIEAAARFDEADLLRIIQFCSSAEVDIRRKFNPRIRLQLMLLKLATLDRSVVLADLIARLEGSGSTAVESRPVKSTPSPKAEPVTSQAKTTSGEETSPVVKSSDPLKAAQEAWTDICGKIAEEHNSSAMMLKYGGYPVSYKDNVLKLHFSSKSHLDAADRCKQTLVRELTELTGKIRIEFEVGELPEEATKREEIEDDPAAKLLFDKLGAQPLD